MMNRSKNNMRVDDPAFYRKLEEPDKPDKSVPTRYQSYKDQEVTQEGCGVKRVFRGWMRKVFGVSPEKGTVEYSPTQDHSNLV